MITLDDMSKQALQNFFRGKASNSWMNIYNSDMLIYVRKNVRSWKNRDYDIFDIANWTVCSDMDEFGAFVELLNYVEVHTNVYIECIDPMNIPFIDMLRIRGYHIIDNELGPNAIFTPYERFSWAIIGNKPIITDVDEAYRRAMSIV